MSRLKIKRKGKLVPLDPKVESSEDKDRKIEELGKLLVELKLEIMQLKGGK